MFVAKTLSEIAPGDHACVVMDSDEQHWEVAAGYVAGGLAHGEKIFYYDGGRSTEPLMRRLREDHVDVARHIRTRQLTVVPPEVTNRLWTLRVDELSAMVSQKVGEALREGYSGVRIAEEPTGTKHLPNGHTVAEYDRALQYSLRGRPITLLCQYERADWSARALDELCANHHIKLITPAIYDDGLLRVTRQGTFRTRVAGEVDFSNRHLIRGVIERELDAALRAAETTREISVHLESLRFADVTAVVQFVQAAEAFPESHKLVLYDAHPQLRRVMDKCGAAFTTQLSLRDRRDHDDRDEIDDDDADQEDWVEPLEGTL